MPGAAVRMEDITVVFNQGTPNEVVALDRINLKIEPGEVVVIIGPNASGKSTLLKVIAGIIPPTKGKVFIDGRDVTGQKDHVRSNKISFVHQDPLMGTCPNLTLFENMVLSAKVRWWWPLPYPVRLGHDQIKVLEYIGLGLRERLSIPLTSFSGGQRQSIAASISFSRGTSLILLDEFTSSLDDATAERVFQTAYQQSQNNNSTLLMIIHDLDRVLEMKKRTLILGAGRLVNDIKDFEIGTMNRPTLTQQVLGKVA